MKANKTLLRMKYARIIDAFAKKTDMPLYEALAFFYQSNTYKLMSEGVGDIHARSDGYLVDELLLERAASDTANI